MIDEPLASVVFVGLSLVAVVALLWGLRELRLAYRLSANDPVSVVEAANGGSVEVTGTVDPVEEVLESPFTETPCVAYEYTIEERRRRRSKNGNRKTWKTIDSGQRSVPFRITDDSGSALVEPAGADFRLSSEGTIRVRGGQQPPEAIERFIHETDSLSDQNRSMGIGPLEMATGRNRRYRERRLDVGGPVHILGTARFETDVPRETGQVNAVIGADESAVADGWRGRLHGRLAGSPFLISDGSEKQTVRRVARTGVLAIVAATFLLAISLLMLVG